MSPIQRLFGVVAVFATCSATLQAVTIPTVPVGNPGNSPDYTGYGAVGYTFYIATYDVTNSQYVDFLNTKDPTGANTLGLWNSNMANTAWGGISFNSGNANGNKFVLITGRQNHPVNGVTWYDAVRFANWLNNGEGNGDTESGAYTLLGGTPIPSNGSRITRNGGAKVFLPSENEWYKAAYYDPGTSAYFYYPTSSNSLPTASSPTGVPNHANYDGVVGNLTDSVAVNAGSDLAADHIVQTALVIGGTSSSRSLVAIDSSDPLGNPLAGTTPLALELPPPDGLDSAFANGTSGAADLDSVADLTPPIVGNTSPVPEPSTLTLLAMVVILRTMCYAAGRSSISHPRCFSAAKSVKRLATIASRAAARRRW